MADDGWMAVTQGDGTAHAVAVSPSPDPRMVHRDRVASRLVYVGAALGLLGWLVLSGAGRVEMSVDAWGQHTQDPWLLLGSGAFALAGMLLEVVARTYWLTGRPPRPWGPGAPTTLTRGQSALIGGASGVLFTMALGIGRLVVPWQVAVTDPIVDPVTVAVEPIRIVAICLVPVVLLAILSETCFVRRERQVERQSAALTAGVASP